MMSSMQQSFNVNQLKSKLCKHGQEHLLAFWDSLNQNERDELIKDIDEIDLPMAVTEFGNMVASNVSTNKFDESLMEPVPETLFGNVNSVGEEKLKSYEELGLQMIADGKLAVLVLAGGQGTRLGVPYPKGMYDLGLPSKKTLFQVQAERIIRLSELATKYRSLNSSKRTTNSSMITWYVMTSESTDGATMEFFQRNGHFGLEPSRVIMFEQYMMPAFSPEGKILLQNRHKVAMSPDGTGGIYKALRDRGILADMETRGIEYVHVTSIDNILVRVGDPVFLGFCATQGSDCGVKVIEKVDPDEALGVVCKVNQLWKVVEYSEISQEAAQRRNPKGGGLLFNAGSICNHLFSMQYLRRICDGYVSQLGWHVAKKKVTTVDEAGNVIKPEKPNAIKMEKFIFDAFPFSENLVVWMVNREQEFSALKNTDEAGFDCPATSRRDLRNLHKNWILNAGAEFVREDDDHESELVEKKESEVVCEISPLISYAGEELGGLNGKKITSPFVLEKMY